VAITKQTERVSHFFFVLAVGKKEEFERKNSCIHLLLERKQGTYIFIYVYKIPENFQKRRWQVGFEHKMSS